MGRIRRILYALTAALFLLSFIAIPQRSARADPTYKLISYGYSIPSAGILALIDEYIFGYWQPNVSTMALTLYAGQVADIGPTITACHNAGVPVSFQLYAPYSDPAYNAVFNDAGLRDTLFDNIVALMGTYAFDGVAFDWECDNQGDPATPTNVTNFYHELYDRFASELPGKTISATENYDGAATMLPAAAGYLEWIGLMTYDVAPPASWYGTLANVQTCVVKWLDAGFSPGDIIVGINFYALYGGTWGLWASYEDILDIYNPSPNANSAGGYYYNGQILVDSKADYVVSEGLGGAFAYVASLDDLEDGRSLLNTIYNVFNSGPPDQPDPPTNVAATDGASTSNVTVTWTASAGATGYYVYRNNVNISGLLGAVVTYTDTTAAAPTITPGAASASDGTNTANVTLTISGQSANNGTTYTYMVRAVMGGEVSGDSATNTGYRGVGSLTYQWWRSAADSDTGYVVLTGATTATYIDETAPAPTLSGGTGAASDGTDTTNVNLSVTGTTGSGAGRYYSCQLNATGAAQVYTSVDRGYRAVSGLTYQWFATSTDYDTGYAIIGGATTAAWAYDAAPDPSITAGAAVASDNLSTSYVTLTLSGSAAVPGAGRWFLCQVSAAGSSANSTHNRGYVGVGALTVQWQRSAADSDAAYSNIAGGVTNPYNDSGAPADGSGRYYKATLTATGAAGATTTVDRGVRLVATPPVVVPTGGNTMGDVFGWAMVVAAIAGIFTGAKNAPRYN